ncbi:uncharacterized protein BP01DRAFT_85207 [Aspergillus saccharolyticus JOP 1030-1]|uniref:CENP-Q, a CENPA-CAD centromere complex subunit-domain-containing protein n=1 Tax=Aspergillus saccharolyticus JOP 1030-1 TaxID=1450539 RepID=A0A318ZD38_9EURO|nr:hypothetical protein BP01DRAFT_85207 [Aspergillus saccharolyticus JOP 1030-1]PYH44224.1 hypothetical protein BP01DRAFT_85207 [Aspergillus saccharolyticus JOP 1030-1]
MPPPKRKRSSQAPDPDNHARNKRFAYLKPQVRQVSERTIKGKWSTLPEPAQDKVRDMFRALERPVIMRQQNESKRIEAQAAVQTLVKNLAKRLPRMPFPPIARDTVFEYEAALKEHCALEASLATMNDSIDLLKVEVEKEEALLEKERRQLQEMERNAKGIELERKRQMKNEHPVLRELSNVPDDRDSNQAGFTIANDIDANVMFDELEADPDVLGLLEQLNDHLKSMQNNTTPLTGLRDAVARSQAALSLTFVPDD